MTRVLGLDPGGTTGLADLSCLEYLPSLPWDVVPKQLADPAEVLTSVQTLLPHLNAVAMEQFVVSRRAGRSSTASAGRQARDLIGAVQELCRQAGVPCVLHTASTAKDWTTDERLKAAGLYVPTRGLGHARDACRHALYTAVWYLRCPDPLTTKERT